MKKLTMLGVAASLMLAACASAAPATGSATNNQIRAEEKKIRESADYWQRSDSVSAQYLTGPKAQHQLHTDIASCVAEVRELVRLGSIRKAEPPKNIAMDNTLKGGWNSVTRNGPLYAEHVPFQDFDGCMSYKGWQRVSYVKPLVADYASRNYGETILGFGNLMAPAAAERNNQPSGFNN